MTGRRLAQYEVAEELSRGGMGVVYRATDTRLKSRRGPQGPARGAGRRSGTPTALVQEAQAASAIEHPHIAVIYDVNEADGHTFIAMEHAATRVAELIGYETHGVDLLVLADYGTSTNVP